MFFVYLLVQFYLFLNQIFMTYLIIIDMFGFFCNKMYAHVVTCLDLANFRNAYLFLVGYRRNWAFPYCFLFQFIYLVSRLL